MTLSSIQRDIECAEQLATQERRTATTSPRATDTDNQTHSGNLPKDSRKSKEAETLKRFNALYDQIPTPEGGEPIQYIEERQEHDEAVLTQLDRQYPSHDPTLHQQRSISAGAKISGPIPEANPGISPHLQ